MRAAAVIAEIGWCIVTDDVFWHEVKSNFDRTRV